MRLHIDAWGNRLLVDGREAAPRTRWVAAFLHCLVERGRQQAGLSRDDLAQALVRHGRPATALHARQAQRLLQALRDVFATFGAQAEFDERFLCAPKGKTSGPWRWLELPGDAVTLAQGDLAATSAATAAWPAALAQSALGTGSVGLAASLKQVLACRRDDEIDLAIDLLREPARWTGATPECQALRRLKLGELLAARRDYSGAGRAFNVADALIRRAVPAARAGLDELLQVQRAIAQYGSQPALNFQTILDGELARSDPLHRHTAEGNPFVEAKRCNLLSLCERRWLEAHRREANPQAWAEHVEAMLRYGHAALFLCLLAEQFERARNVSANLAYAHQKLAHWRLVDRAEAEDVADLHLRCAIEWYAVSMSFHARFGLTDNPAYLFVFLGELWLSGPVARTAFEAAWRRIVWDGERPDQAAFYRDACDCAQRSGDPRQMAYASLNELRFGEIAGEPAVRTRGLRRLRALLEAHPDLTQTLRDEGYAIPPEALQGCAGSAAPGPMRPADAG